MKPFTYTCAACGETSESEISDEEALAEAKLLWGDIPPEQRAVICDDCFNSGFANAKAAFQGRTGDKDH